MDRILALALFKAIRAVYGSLAVVQRCQVHKRRNVLDQLPDHMHAHVGRVLKQAWDAKSKTTAERQLRQLAASLEREHPGAAASLREGLEETLTLIELGASGSLYRTLRTTNPIENLNGSVEWFIRNVKRWRGGAMIVGKYGGVRSVEEVPSHSRLRRSAGTHRSTGSSWSCCDNRRCSVGRHQLGAAHSQR